MHFLCGKQFLEAELHVRTEEKVAADDPDKADVVLKCKVGKRVRHV